MLRDRYTEALWSPVRTAVLQQNALAKLLTNKQFEITYSTNVCLIKNYSDAGIWRNNVILSVLVLVKAVGVKLLKVNSNEITVFQCDAV